MKPLLRRLALGAALLPVLLGPPACRKAPEPPKPAGPMTLAIPATGAYTGAFIDFGDNEDEVTLEGIEDFEQLVGKHQAIVASSSYWGEQSFPSANLNIIRRHGSVPLVFWSPWDRPYAEDDGPDKFSLIAITDGVWDAYIDRWADAARDFGYPIMVSFANEMNGTWFPWSGCFYGGREHGGAGRVLTQAPVWTPTPTPAPKLAGANAAPPAPTATPVPLPKEPPYHGTFVGPETFKKAYRHVVDRVRARGALNIIWVFHAMNYSIPQDTWNMVSQYYPGSDYVDWLGLSVYGEQYAEDAWSPFLPLLEWPYEELRRLDSTKPIMLAEWGVGEFPKKGNKTAFIADAFEAMRTRFPQLHAAVYWHERWQNDEGDYSNLRVNSTPESLSAYRRGVANPFWLSEPQLAPLPQK